MTEILILLVFPAGMILAGAMDIFTMTISNRIALALLAGFAALALVTGMPLADVGMHVTAGLAMLAVAFALFCAGWIGGGDAKLFAVTALWLGWSNLFEYALLASVYGGILTIGLVLARTRPLPAFALGQDWLRRLHKPRGDVPYGVALALAALAVYPHTVWMTG